MLNIIYKKHLLKFKFEAGTSRGVLTERDTYFISVFDSENPKIKGIGEASPLKDLSIDYRPDFEKCLQTFIDLFHKKCFTDTKKVPYSFLNENLSDFPSILFALEMALLDLENGGQKLIFKNDFVLKNKAIAINGLVWMGEAKFMQTQIEEKLLAGYNCLKLKIGAIDFEQELDLLQQIRKRFSKQEITLRVDANGAFGNDVLEKLQALAKYDLHSIEQPIKAGQHEKMAEICLKSPIPIALDEELIGIKTEEKNLLKTIKPQFIILKPTLLGGFEKSKKWIQIAENQGIGWWLTSALESNVGLNGIAQFAYEYNLTLPQGLGTGQLYWNNIESPLQVENGEIFYKKEGFWDFL